MPTDKEADADAVGIYVVMTRDWSDALEMINECNEVRTLETLYTMLTTKGRPNTDQELNDLMAGPTKRRLDALTGARITLEEALKRAKKPKVGDYEFCRRIGGDGMFHMFVVIRIDDTPRGPEVVYMPRCGNVPIAALSEFEVARSDESCNCLPCML